MRIHVTHPADLGAAEIERWRALTARDPALASPFFSPGYALAVAAARKDARLAVIETGGAMEGFFAVQRPSSFAAMPLGAPMTDQQGIVGAVDLAVRSADLCRALKVDRIDFDHVLAHQTAFVGAHRGVAGSWVAELDGGAEGYLAMLRERRNDTVRQQDKKRRKLAREHGAPVITSLSRNRAHLDQLLAWKQDQCRRTGQPPIWATPWVLDVVNAAWESEAPDFRCALFTLEVGGALVAANFFLAGQTVLNDWLIGHDHAFDTYSPGIMLARHVCEWAAENGFREVDFGPGDYQYKRQLTTTQRPLAWGFAGRPSAAALVRGAQYGVRALLEGGSFGRLSALPGKAMRRLDVCRGLGVPVLAAH